MSAFETPIKVRKEFNSFSDKSTRRRYPLHKEGGKDEWHALMKHQMEVDDTIAHYQKSLKNMHNKQLGEEYLREINGHAKEKQIDNMIKRRERELISLDLAKHKMDLMKEVQDTKLIKDSLRKTYDHDVVNKKEHNNAVRFAKIKEEREKLEGIQGQFEKERELKNLKKAFNYNLITEDLENFLEKRKMNQQDKIKEDLVVKDMIKQNEDKQLLNEINYRNFFQAANDQQRKYYEAHERNVHNINQEKEKGLENLIKTRMNNEQQRQMMADLDKGQLKKDMYDQAKNVWDNQVDYKTFSKNMAKIEKDKRLNEVVRDTAEYREYLRNSRKDQLDRQNDYRTYLEAQERDAREGLKANRMTKEEKKMNFSDLQAYKASDPRLYALVPGLTKHHLYAYNAGAFRRGPFANTGIPPDAAVREYNNHPITQSTINFREENTNNNITRTRSVSNMTKKVNERFSLDLKEHLNPNVNTGPSTTREHHPASAENNKKFQNSHIIERSSYKFNEPPLEIHTVTSPVKLESILRDRHQRSISTTRKGIGNEPPVFEIKDTWTTKRERVANTNIFTDTSAATVKGGHNPITNPLPVNIQNPYILKQISVIKERLFN